MQSRRSANDASPPSPTHTQAEQNSERPNTHSHSPTKSEARRAPTNGPRSTRSCGAYPKRAKPHTEHTQLRQTQRTSSNGHASEIVPGAITDCPAVTSKCVTPYPSARRRRSLRPPLGPSRRCGPTGCSSGSSGGRRCAGAQTCCEQRLQESPRNQGKPPSTRRGAPHPMHAVHCSAGASRRLPRPS